MSPVNRACTSKASNPELNEKAARKLAIISGLIFMLVVPAVCFVRLEIPCANYIAFALTASVIASVYVAFALIELKVAGELIGLKAAVFLWVIGGGILVWFSRADAMANVNEIFGVDASLLPMTTAAATFIHTMRRLVPVFYAAALISIVMFLLTVAAARMRKERPVYAVCHLANTLSFLVVSSLASDVMSLDRRRDQILYHLAHRSDFNSKSPCRNVNAQIDDVLYLDGAHQKILIASKIIEHEPTVFSTFSLLAPISFSREFKHLECEYRFEKPVTSE